MKITIIFYRDLSIHDPRITRQVSSNERVFKRSYNFFKKTLKYYMKLLKNGKIKELDYTEDGTADITGIFKIKGV